jgi:hypothetical protein
LRPRAKTAWPWILLLAACTNDPGRPRFENPLDPRGPGSGDPFRLAVAVADVGGLLLSWDDISARYPDLTGYRIYAGTNPSVDESDFRSSTGIGDGTVIEYLDVGYTRDAINYYKVVAERGSEISSLATLNAAQVYAPPTAWLSNGRFESATPQVKLRLLPVVSDGDVFELSRTSDFAAPLAFTDTAGEIDFDLGTVAANGDSIRLYSRIRYAGGAATSPVGVDRIAARLEVELTPLVFGALTDTIVAVSVGPLVGVERMRIANSQAALAAQPWQVPETPDLTVLLVHLDASLLAHRIWGQFESSFGFLEEIASGELTAVDQVDPASFSLEAGRLTVQTRNIQITDILAPGAGYMRFSEDINFTAVPWQSFAPQDSFMLSPGTGVKQVYGQFRNPFGPEDVESFVDSIELLGLQ